MGAWPDGWGVASLGGGVAIQEGVWLMSDGTCQGRGLSLGGVASWGCGLLGGAWPAGRGRGL